MSASVRLGLSITHVETVARALRGALLRHATDPPPAVLSGHEPDGRRLERPHAAFLALPTSEDGHAPGVIGGVALALPRDIAPTDHRAFCVAIEHWERSGARLLMGRLGAMTLARVDEAHAGEELALGSLAGCSREWATVTPVALQRNPGELGARDAAAAARALRRAEEAVVDACQHVGLPRPVEVKVLRRPVLPRMPPAPAFMPHPRLGSGFKRVCVHAALRFAEEVAGPVVIGVGRYFGVGMFARRAVQS
jgi:CRISPR-associated protein Csb2